MFSRQQKAISHLIALIFLLIPIPSVSETLLPASGRGISETEILPADVLARVEWLREELELIRLELGKPHLTPIDITVLNTSPREVYFTAHALFNKSNRLAFEQTKTSLNTPAQVDVTLIRPFHVWQLVNQSLLRIQEIKEKLNIPEKSREYQYPDATEPSDVIKSTLLANRIVSELLDNKVSSGDVFEQVTSSINLAAQLLATFKNTTRIPPAPAFERQKTPSNVYQRLYTCFALIREIAKLSNLPILDFKLANQNAVKKPSDVYDLATLVVSELAYFHSLRKQALSPAKSYFPGEKTPAHVFQRVGILEAQLESLLLKVKKNPTWLSSDT